MHANALGIYAMAIMMIIVLVGATPSATVTSSSNYIGDSVNYTVTLANHTINGSSPTTISFSFSNWSLTVANPFQATRSVYLYSNQLTCPNAFPLVIQCTFINPNTNTAAWTNGNTSNMVFNLTGMYNPSSSKPYTFFITLKYSNGSTTMINTTITTTLMTTAVFSLNGYSYSIGATSLSAYFSLDMNNYFSSATYLAMSFNSSLISISGQSTSSYSIISTTSNSTTGIKTILISTWQSTNTPQNMTNWNISNPAAALSYTLSGYLYWIQGANTWNISLYSCAVQLTPISFTTMASASILQYGSSIPVLSINATCSLTANNQSNTSLAYITLVYDPTILSTTNSSSCTYLTNASCKYPSTTSPLTVNGLYTNVVNANVAILTISSYTYWSPSATFYPLCSSTLTLPIATQSISSTIEGCGSGAVNAANTANITISAYSYKLGDIITLSGFKGTISNAIQWYSNGTGTVGTSYSHVLASSDYIINTTYAKIALAYTNPSYVASPNALTSLKISRILGNTTLVYANTGSTSICPVTIPSAITVSSLTATNKSTYASTNLSIIVSLTLFDYTVSDSMVIAFKTGGKDNVYALANSLSITINTQSMNYSQYNTTAIKIFLGDFTNINGSISILPTSQSPLWTIVIANISNAIQVQTESIYLTTYSSVSSTAKEALQSPLAYTLTALSLLFSITPLHPLTSQHLYLSISAPLRSVALRNSSVLASSISITIPATLNCSSSSLTSNWMTSVATTSSPFSGNTTNLVVDLGVCNVGYFKASQLSISSAQTINNVSSSSTTFPLVNTCGDNCYACTAPSVCTQCFASNYSTSYLYYQSACYPTCPTSSFLNSSNSSCISCHSTCLTCSGSAYSNCLSCPAGWSILSNTCISPCGNYYYLNGGQCEQCNINCQNCISSDVCYICKSGAVLIGDVCQFVDCASPCSTCEGSQSNCTSCLQPLAFYNNSCFSSCPSGTYQSNNKCVTISQGAVYIPITITSLVIIILLVIFRYYSAKKLTNITVPTYKLNVLRISAVLLSYMEMTSILVILIKNGMYSTGSISTTLAILGIISGIVCNIAFAIAYWRIIVKNRVKNDSTAVIKPNGDISNGDKPNGIKSNGIKSNIPAGKGSPRAQDNSHPAIESHNEEERSEDEEKRQQNNNSLKQKFIVVLSCIFTFRTYKILYSNLFIYRRFPSEIPKTVSNNPAMMSSSQLINPKPSPTNNVRTTDNPTKKNNSKIPPSQPATLVNTQITSALRATVLSAIDNDDTPAQRKFNHPFLTYLTIVSLLTTSLLYLLSGIIEAIRPSFSQMMIWGIDAILVVSLSLIMNGLDLWMFVNLAKQQQESEMSSVKDDANNTLQNLKVDAGLDDKAMQDKLKRKNSVGSNRSRSRSPSETKEGNQSRRKSRDGTDLIPYDHIPALKVFEDIDEPTMPHQQTRKEKRKWNAGRGKPNVNNSFSRNHRNASNNNLPSHKPLGYKLDDIYLNFKEDPPADLNISRPNFSEIPHREEDGTMSMVNIEGNFDDISGLGADDAKFEEAVKFNLEDVVKQIQINPFQEIKGVEKLEKKEKEEKEEKEIENQGNKQKKEQQN